MNINDKELLYQCFNVSTALVRNLNDHFIHVSFDIMSDGKLWVKVVLSYLGEAEQELIDDMIGEIEVAQLWDCVESVIVSTSKADLPLKNIVYYAGQ